MSHSKPLANTHLNHQVSDSTYSDSYSHSGFDNLVEKTMHSDSLGPSSRPGEAAAVGAESFPSIDQVNQSPRAADSSAARDPNDTRSVGSPISNENVPNVAAGAKSFPSNHQATQSPRAADASAAEISNDTRPADSPIGNENVAEAAAGIAGPCIVEGQNAANDDLPSTGEANANKPAWLNLTFSSFDDQHSSNTEQMNAHADQTHAAVAPSYSASSTNHITYIDPFPFAVPRMPKATSNTNIYSSISNVESAPSGDANQTNNLAVPTAALDSPATSNTNSSSRLNLAYLPFASSPNTQKGFKYINWHDRVYGKGGLVPLEEATEIKPAEDATPPGPQIDWDRLRALTWEKHSTPSAFNPFTPPELACTTKFSSFVRPDPSALKIHPNTTFLTSHKPAQNANRIEKKPGSSKTGHGKGKKRGSATAARKKQQMRDSQWDVEMVDAF